MQRLFIALSFLLFAWQGKTQNLVNDSTVTTISYWKKGEKSKLSIIKVKKEWEKGELRKTDSNSYQAELSVLEAGTSYYTMQWKYLTPSQALPQNNALQKVLFTGLSFKYRITEMGEFENLQNWQEVQRYVYKTINILAAQEKNTKTKELLTTELKMLFGSKESIETVVLKEVQLYHNIFGSSYQLNEQLKAKMELPNFLGGDPLPAVGTVELSEINAVENYCTVKVTQQYDKEKLTEALNAWAQRLAKKDLKMPLLSLEDVVLYKIELSTGWILSINSQRTITVDDTIVKEQNVYTKVN